MSQGNFYKLNDKQQKLAQEKLMVIQLAQKEFQIYMAGVMAGIGLDGDWKLDINTWTFEKVEKPEEGESNAKRCSSQTYPYSL